MLVLPRLACASRGARLAPRLSSFPLRYSSTTTTATNPTTSTPASPSFFTPSPEDAHKPFFITTPIFYVNASPHIGHLHSIVLADVFARFSRLRHPERPVVFSTGTDEHGLKIQQAAAKAGVSEVAFCDEVSQRFRDLADLANISYTDFIRTSEARHYAAVEAFWARLVASGQIYKGAHEGWYAVSDECFYSAAQVAERDGKMIALESGSEVTWETEENWKFRLDAFKPQLQAWLANAETVYPPAYHQDISRQVDAAGELSISRPSSRVKWGVPVPGDPSQTIYVWVDALINYITVAGYPGAHDAWPVDMHVVGKDIVRFHAFHWPALLAAAGEPLPKRVLAHAHWTMHKYKMSKSRGNVADPIAAVGKYGVDGVRWYLMRAGGSLPDDADYSEAELAGAYSRLQDQMGNLVGRISSPRVLKKVAAGNSGDMQRSAVLDEALANLRDEYERRFEAYDLRGACALLLETLAEANRYFSEAAPWRPEADAAMPVAYAYAALRLVGILAQPVMPSKAVELLDRLGVPSSERTWAAATWLTTGAVDASAIPERIRAAGKHFKGRPPLFPKVDEVPL